MDPTPEEAAWEDGIREFAKAILHGDDEHRRWLLEAAEQFIQYGTVPERRG